MATNDDDQELPEPDSHGETEDEYWRRAELEASAMRSGKLRRDSDKRNTEPESKPMARRTQLLLVLLAVAALVPLTLDLAGSGLSRADVERALESGQPLALPDQNLRAVNLSEMDLSGANLQGADLSRAILIETNLERANLRGANLTGANLSKANLMYADLSEAILDEVIALDTRFASANLEGAHGESAEFTGCDFRSANFKESFFEKAHFARADLRWSDLTNANFRFTNLVMAKTDQATMDGVDLFFAER